MRFGMHSGAVTAGVFRGTKARFQLFGDTVNTCARVESTGIKGRIHASQGTADALILAGKESWLTLRQDKVVAKGKGEMVTYWVAPKCGTGSVDTFQTQESMSITGRNDSDGNIDAATGALDGSEIARENS